MLYRPQIVQTTNFEDSKWLDAKFPAHKVLIWYTHKTSGFKTSGFKMSGFKTSGFKTLGLQNVRFTKRQASKRMVSKRPVFKFDILINKKHLYLSVLLITSHYGDI